MALHDTSATNGNVENGIPASSQMTAPQVVPQTQNVPQKAEPALYHQTFLRAKPKALGIVLIISALLQIGLGFGLWGEFTVIYCYTYDSFVSFWGATIVIIAGSLSITAGKIKKLSLIQATLAFTIMASVSSLVGIVLPCLDYGSLHCIPPNFGSSQDYETCLYEKDKAWGIFACLIAINLQSFGICLAIAVFACQAVNQNGTNVPQAFILQNGAVFSVGPQPFQATASPTTTL
ncbi:membrane-spanning 4-domains subfamily A member 12-like [Dendropsophus ebraccatus]|uniref:membrane-spanning 4-domains subfamily A member 12-like n=1 Tax=Dendropsophus ebraccatus TaxID=150705 RepID=UPI003831C791